MSDDSLASESFFLPQGFGLPAKAEDYEDALKQDAWTWTEALCWLKGRLPDECRAHQLPKHYPQEVDAIHRAMRVGTLTKDSSTPREWVDWATKKGWGMPEAFQKFTTESMTNMESLPAATVPALGERPETELTCNEQVSMVGNGADSKKLYTKAAAINALAKFVRSPEGLNSLFSNASKKPELKACQVKARGGWDLVALFDYLARHNYLKGEFQTEAGKIAFIKSIEIS